MGVGVEIYGQAGNLQASTDRFTWALSGHGSLLMTDTGSTHPQPRVRGYIDVAGVNPEIFIAPPTGRAVYLEQFQPISGGVRYWFGAVSSQPVAFQYWVFDVPSQGIKDPALANKGIQVFDPSLTITFDAATDTLDVKNLVEITTPPSQAATTNGSVSYNRFELAEQATIAIPAGRKYAVSIAGLANIQGMQDTGQYAMGSGYPSGQPIIRDPDDGGIPPGGGQWQWRRMRLDTLWSGCEIENGYLSVGNNFVEQFEGWYPMGTTEQLSCYGKARFMIADVTDLDATGLPSNPNAPVVNVNATERRVEINGPTQNTISPQVSLSISGGTAPYSVQWEFVGGSNTVAAYGSTTGTTFSTVVYNQTPDSTHTAVWRARVVSATNVVSYSQEVTFTHVATPWSADYTPDALGFGSININTNEGTGWLGTTSGITGINQTVGLRIERYDYSGNLSTCLVHVYTGPSANGPWEHHGSFDVLGSGYRYVDINVTNGRFVHYAIDASTLENRRTGQFRIVTHNLSTGGAISDIWNYVTVDADNNLTIPDFTTDAVDWPSISGSTSANDLAQDNGYRTLTGINRNVTIRATISGLSGNLTAGSRLEMYVNGSLRYHSTNLGNGSWAGGDFAPGDQIAFVAKAVSSDGAERSGAYTVTVQNLSSGQTMDTFTVNQSVAGPDYVPNALGWGNVTYADNANTLWNGPAATLTGFNRTIVVRVERYNFSGWMDGLVVHVYRDYGQGWIHQGSFDPRSGGQQYVDFAVNPGDSIHYAVSGSTNSGRQQADFNMVVWALTGGSNQIANHNVTAVVDADNNYNIPDYTPDTPSFPALTLYTNENSGWTNTAAWTVSGINRAITLRFTRGNQADSGGSFTRRFFIYHSTNGGASWNEHFIGAGAQGVLDLVVNNGDLIHMRTYFDTSQGRGDSSFNAYITNLTTGAHIATLNVSGTTDADNNYYGGVAAVDWQDFSVWSDNTNGGSHLPNWRQSNTVTISGLQAGQTATLSMSGSASGDALMGAGFIKNGVYQGDAVISNHYASTVDSYYGNGITVANGDTIAIRASVVGFAADQWTTYTSAYKSMSLAINASAGGQIDTITIDGNYTDTYSTGGGGPGGPIEVS